MGLKVDKYSKALKLVEQYVSLPYDVRSHMLRYGDAILDFLNEITLFYIRARGRWVSEKQCPVYLNAKSYRHRLQTLSEQQTRRWTEITNNMGHVFEHGTL